MWRDRLGKAVTPYASADGNGNGVVDAADYQVWISHFGQTVGGAGSAAGSIEEVGLPPSASNPRLGEAASVAGAGSSVQVAPARLRISDLGLGIGESAAEEGRRSTFSNARELIQSPIAIFGTESAREAGLLVWLGERRGDFGFRQSEEAGDYGMRTRNAGDGTDAADDATKSIDEVFAGLAVM